MAAAKRVKKFRLGAKEIRPLAPGLGSCIASDRITVDGLPVRFLYREEPSHDQDSGWRFFSGTESQEYTDEPDNFEIYDVNTIANYTPEIVPMLDAPVGAAFEQAEPGGPFALVPFAPPDD